MPAHAPDPLPRIPGWIGACVPEAIEEAALFSGAALAHLHHIQGAPGLPAALWRDRLALLAAEACVGFAGRREGVAALRDALHLARPGDSPGPAGEIARCWTRAAAGPLSSAALARALPGLDAGQVAPILDSPGASLVASPVARAAATLQAVLEDSPRAETAALILADAALAKALGWSHLLPLLATRIKPRELRLRDDALRLACHRALVSAAIQAAGEATDLARRAERLRAVAPKLRARGAAQAVDLFLTRDAVAPAALAGVMSDRAARRFCDRLVDLGAVRELTGRETFRLYGV